MTISPTFITAAASFNRLGVLTDDEEKLRLQLISQLNKAKKANRRQVEYYEGGRVVRDLGISIPPQLRDVETVAAWPEIITDVLDERLDWLRWDCPGDADLTQLLGQIADENHFAVELGGGKLDALICGLSFIVVGTGDEDAGEPETLMTIESPSRMTARWNARIRRADQALAETYDPDTGVLNGWTVYLPDQTVSVRLQGERSTGRGPVVVERDEHGLGRVPVAVMRNRPRGSRLYGRSEITRAVRNLTDQGVRTLLRMEVTAEFYSAPQRYLMGADEAMFVGPDGKKRSQWDAVIGKMLAIPRDDEGDVPTAGQFPAASPQPHIDHLRALAQMVSAASGVPAPHLGFTSDSNPASADAIREANSRLDKRALRRIDGYDPAIVEAGELALLWRDGAVPPAGTIRSRWADPSTPTPAASADRALKLVQGGIWVADSQVTLEQTGLSPEDIERMQADRRRANARARLDALATAAGQARTDPAVADASQQRGAGDVPPGGEA